MSKHCDYYLAPQSPFVYLGHQRFAALANQYNVQVSVKPIDLGKVFNVSGGLPLPKRAPQRQAYRMAELKRWSAFLQLPMNPEPTFFPVAGDPAAKLIIAAKIAHGDEAAMALAGGVARAVWEEERNIADIDTLIGIAAACDLDANRLIESSGSADVQTEYDRNTEEAIAANVFGVPWFVTDGEGYWGQDRLDFVERAFAK
jgi:2-hydroxychromene-2-carboxylate isomerase